MRTKKTTAASPLVAANDLVRNYTMIGLSPAILPIPLLSGLVLAGLQLRMLQQIAKFYDVEFSRDIGKSLIATLVGSGLPSALAISFVPVVGRLVGAVGMAMLGGASTYALGKVFIQHFESGGTMLTFDPERMRAHYERHAETILPPSEASFSGVKP